MFKASLEKYFTQQLHRATIELCIIFEYQNYPSPVTFEKETTLDNENVSL